MHGSLQTLNKIGFSSFRIVNLANVVRNILTAKICSCGQHAFSLLLFPQILVFYLLIFSLGHVFICVFMISYITTCYHFVSHRTYKIKAYSIFYQKMWIALLVTFAFHLLKVLTTEQRHKGTYNNNLCAR